MTDPNGEDPALLLWAPDSPEAQSAAAVLPRGSQGKPRRLRTALGLLIAIPALLTLAGAITSPPHVKSVPVGHLIYLEGDEPSDHTAILRGLRIMGPDGSSRQLLHEYEPQDQDAGSREWISQPTASPDGHWLAFEKQDITLQEEQQGVANQLWVMPLTGPNPQPRMLLDLTRQKLKQFLGLAWTADSKQIVFLNDAAEYKITAASGGLTRHALTIPGFWLPLKTKPTMSATQNPTLRRDGGADDVAFEPTAGPQDVVRAASPDGRQSARVVSAALHDPAGQNVITVGQAEGLNGPEHRYTARWGWSAFGGRHITALKWSPDGKYLAYSVSKPPLEDELFFIDLASGKCRQLPVRTGRAGWDWAR